MGHHNEFPATEAPRLADEDNENDEYHPPVPILDVWAEYYRLWKELGWIQQQIADAKAIHTETVRIRCKLHESCPDIAKKGTQDGILDEGHLIAIIAVAQDVLGLSPWLTSEQAQTELTKTILDKHRGSSTGIKPTVKKAVCDGLFDEGHCDAIFDVICDVGHLSFWLTTGSDRKATVS